MKKTLFIFVLSLLLVPSAFAGFVDYGVSSEGKQCYDEKDESGDCDIVYSNDMSVIGDSASLDVRMSSKVAQPNGPTALERTERQAEVRRQICMILGC